MLDNAKTLDSHADDYTPVVRRRLELGRYVLAQDYVRAMEGRELLRRQAEHIMEKTGPTATRPARRRAPVPPSWRIPRRRRRARGARS